MQPPKQKHAATTTAKANYICQYENEEEAKLWEYYRLTKQVNFRDQLFARYQSIGVAELRSYIKRNGLEYLQRAERDELTSECNLAILTCIKAYIPERGVKFEVYVRTRIRGSFTDWVRKSDNFPRIVAKLRKAVNRLRAIYASRHGRQPNDEELVTEFGDDARNCLKDGLTVSSVKAIGSMKAAGEDAPDDSVLAMSRTTGTRSAHITDKVSGDCETVKAIGEIVRDKQQLASIVLYYFDGYTNAKIAHLYGKSISTVIEWRRQGLITLAKNKDILAEDLGITPNGS